MKPTGIIAVGLLSLLALAPAAAQVYQWKDSSGRTVISDTPPPANARGSRTIQAPSKPDAAATPPEETAPAPKTMAEKDADFRKRQVDSRQKADKQAKEEAAAADRKDNCLRAQRQLATLESGERLVSRDSQGEKRYLEDAERQQEIERARKLVSDLCK